MAARGAPGRFLQRSRLSGVLEAYRLPPAAPAAAVRFRLSIFLLFLLAALLVNYPGRLNEDSLEQVINWRVTGQMSDLHSPTLSLLMGLLGDLLGQPQGALLLQALPLAFFAAIVPAARPRRRQGWIALALEAMFKLSLIVSAGYLIKDVFLAGVLLSLLGTVQLALSSPRPWPWLAAAAALAGLALAVRSINFLMFLAAAALFVPFVVRSARAYLLTLAIAGVLLFFSVPLQSAFDHRILGAYDSRAERQLIIFDAAGISVATGGNRFASLPGWPAHQLPPPSHCHSPQQWGNFAYWGRCRGYTLAFNQYLDRSGRRAALRWWLGNLVAHPLAYARHRLAFTRELLVSEADEGWRHHLHGINTPERIHILRRSAAGRIHEREVATWRENAVAVALAAYASLLYQHRFTEASAAAACILLLGWSWSRMRSGLPLDIVIPLAAAIGIANLLVYIPFGIASWSRYLWPTVCCALFGLSAAVRTADRLPSTPR